MEPLYVVLLWLPRFRRLDHFKIRVSLPMNQAQFAFLLRFSYIFLMTFELNLSDLPLTTEVLLRGLGYNSIEAPHEVEVMTGEVLGLLFDHVDIRCGYAIVEPEMLHLGVETIKCGTMEFHTGSIITKRLRNSEALAVYATTAGAPLDAWAAEHFSAGDPLKGFLIDSAGSEIAELAADWLEQRVAGDAAAKGWQTTNRYSPGYCEWHLREQHKLFSLLHDRFCGIALTESALMLPKKSTSGLIGLGADVKREDYQCSICELKDCFRRRE
jgi:hypothetical protein